MSLEKLDEAYKRYKTHLNTVSQRNIEDAKAKLLAEHHKYTEEINNQFNKAITNFEAKLKH